MHSIKKKRAAYYFLQTAVLLILGLVVILPIYIAAVNAFKDSGEIVGSPLGLPLPPTLENLQRVLTSPDSNILQIYANSLTLMICGTIITIVLASMASYYLARSQSRLAKVLRIYFLIGIMVPYVIVYLPLCILLNKLKIGFGVPLLIFVFVSGNLSFSTFMYTNFIRSLPGELEESAAIDGAKRVQVFWRILFPLVKPCTATVGIFVGLGIWNDFQTPLLLGQVKTITVGIYTAIGPHSADWGIVFAYVFFAAAPVIAAYLAAQKQFVSGLTSGALKG